MCKTKGLQNLSRKTQKSLGRGVATQSDITIPQFTARNGRGDIMEELTYPMQLSIKTKRSAQCNRQNLYW